MKNILELNKVRKQFGDFVAVKDLSFEVRQGSIFGLLGPNGAGKTTTIRMIVNIFAPDSGEIILFGEPVSPRLKHKIGYLPEERGLYKKMKVGEQLLFFARLKGVEKAEALRRIEEWLDRLDLSAWISKDAIELSKGMQQKVQFIVSIIHDPDLLILDEPFSGLDPVSVKLLKGVILDLKQRGKTIIFSTHQMEQVEQICDDICLINHATKVLGGSLREVKQRFGHNAVQLDYEGSSAFLDDATVKNISRYPNYVEIPIDSPIEAQAVLKKALSAGVCVNRFQMVEQSLNDIFIESVGGNNGKNNGNNHA